MKTSGRVFSIWAGAVTLALFGLVVLFASASADIAPPESPPGVVIAPGSESTQVRMVSEVVTLTLISSGDLIGKVKTEAVFIMHNQGSSDERLDVRFPLNFGNALYYKDVFPEISDFKAQVEGRAVTTTRTISKLNPTGSDIPWASFPVTFPAGVDVKIRAEYTTQGFGYDNEPFRYFKYILETGAGWKDTIGSGELIVRLPFDATPQNVVISRGEGFSQVAGEPVYSKNEARWRFENLEPTTNDNFEVELVSLPSWKNILVERQNTSNNPKDGEAWGRLGKAIKTAITFPKGYLREDAGGLELFDEAVAAYTKSVTILPNDALWHYGFAELLWSHYFYSSNESRDISEMAKLVNELRLSLQIDPTNQKVNDLVKNVSVSYPWALAKTNTGYDFLVLTATPTEIPVTFTVTPTREIVAGASLTPKSMTPTTSGNIPLTVTPAITQGGEHTTPTKPVSEKNPICGSILVLPLLLLGLLRLIPRKN
jgi:hypothetical protein